MYSLRCLCLERLRLAPKSVSGADAQCFLWSTKQNAGYRKGSNGRLHSALAVVPDKTWSFSNAGALMHVRNGWSILHGKYSAGHMMKRTMCTTPPSASLPLDQPEEGSSPPRPKTKPKKNDVKVLACPQEGQSSRSHSAERSMCGRSKTEKNNGKVCVEELGQHHLTGVSSHLTKVLNDGEVSRPQTPAASSSGPDRSDIPSLVVGSTYTSRVNWGQLHSKMSVPCQPLLSSNLAGLSAAQLAMHSNPVAAFESFRYYHPTSPASATSPQVQNRCHILFDDEDQKAVQEGVKEEEKPQSSKQGQFSTSSESPIYISSPDSSPESFIDVSSAEASLDPSDSKTSVQEQDHKDAADYLHGDAAQNALHVPEAVYKEKLLRGIRKLPRQWEYTPVSYYHGNRHSQAVDFSIMTYNILAQNLLENHPYLYSESAPHSLNWNNRRQRLLAELEHHSPDIINMQEVQHNHFQDDLQPKLKEMGYKGVYQKRSNSSDGCATLWKEDKFQLLRCTPVSYQRGGVLDRDNIALIVELLPIRGGKSRKTRDEDKLVVANTHLLFNPRRGDVKLAQLMVLLAEIDKCAFVASSKSDSKPKTTAEEHSHLHPSHWADGSRAGTYSPVIMTGDFNLEPYSELYKFIIKGHLEYDGLLVRSMSGQQEGRYGMDRLLERNFFSPAFGITERCQYHMEVNNRFQRLHGADASKHKSVPSRENVCVDLTENSEKEEEEWECKPVAPMRVNTGSLWHHLNFVSAYRHWIERFDRRKPEVTTHHDKAACTVDYIFYTVASKEVKTHRKGLQVKHIRDGRLRLIARYGLMSSEEIARMGSLPNHILASDHVCLLAKFQLK